MSDPTESAAIKAGEEFATWRLLCKSMATALSSRGVKLDERDLRLVTRFLMEEIEAKGLRLAPVKPTKTMIAASRAALDKGKRMSVAWVGERTKRRWRLAAGIEAPPCWRIGYEYDVLREESGQFAGDQAQSNDTGA